MIFEVGLDCLSFNVETKTETMVVCSPLKKFDALEIFPQKTGTKLEFGIFGRAVCDLENYVLVLTLLLCVAYSRQQSSCRASLQFGLR